MKVIVRLFFFIIFHIIFLANCMVLEGEEVGKDAGYENGNQKNIAGRENYRYMVFLDIYNVDPNRYDNYFCGGSLISGRVVLTAAHCLRRYKDIDVYAVAGTLNILQERKKEKAIRMYDYLVHEGYAQFAMHRDKNGFRHITNYRNDIALVWLEKRFTYSPKIHQIELILPNSKLMDKTGMILGWGQTEKGKCSPMLRSAKLRVVHKSECEYGKDGTFYYIDESMLCIKSDNEKSQQCSGDSGGPFVVDGKLAGIISNSYKEPLELKNGRVVEMSIAKIASVVTNVKHFKQWILTNTNLGPPKDRKKNQNRPVNKPNQNAGNTKQKNDGKIKIKQTNDKQHRGKNKSG